MRYIKLLLIFSLLVVAGRVWGQTATTAQDSLLQYLVKNQDDLKSVIENYQSVTFNWKQLLATFTGIVFFGGLTWKLWAEEWIKSHIKIKAQEALESMANMKTMKILVLSGEKSSNEFLQSFFEEKKFPNVRFKPEKGFTPDVIFANNEDGTLDKDVVRQSVKEDMVLFYFGKAGSWDWQNDTPEISRKINFANSRAQIYGNLMSSLEFLALVKPKIKNV